MILGIDHKDIAFYGMAVVLYFLVPWVLVQATYSEHTRLDLAPLWTHQGRIDKFAVILLIAFWVHTSSLILWTMLRTVSTADYLAYGGIWITPIIAKMFTAAFGNGQQQNGSP